MSNQDLTDLRKNKWLLSDFFLIVIVYNFFSMVMAITHELKIPAWLSTSSIITQQG